jgi:tyrosyl-tRNA synthetase
MKLFTFLPEDRIREFEEMVLTEPAKRAAQRELAAQCTAVVHGEEAVASVEAVSRILFSASNEVPSPETVAMLAGEVPVTRIGLAELDAKVGLVDLLVRTHLAESKGAARKLIEGGGVYLGNQRQTVAAKSLSREDVNWPGAVLLRAGKKNYHLVVLE